jgi:hypothetical protein
MNNFMRVGLPVRSERICSCEKIEYACFMCRGFVLAAHNRLIYTRFDWNHPPLYTNRNSDVYFHTHSKHIKEIHQQVNDIRGQTDYAERGTAMVGYTGYWGAGAADH